jgi:hypothetical protein
MLCAGACPMLASFLCVRDPCAPPPCPPPPVVGGCAQLGCAAPIMRLSSLRKSKLTGQLGPWTLPPLVPNGCIASFCCCCCCCCCCFFCCSADEAKVAGCAYRPGAGEYPPPLPPPLGLAPGGASILYLSSSSMFAWRLVMLVPAPRVRVVHPPLLATLPPTRCILVL